MPKDPRLDRVFRYVTLEVGLSVGATLVLLGLAGTAWALSDWGTRGRSAICNSPTHSELSSLPCSRSRWDFRSCSAAFS